MALAAIIGGAGRMGGWFANHLAANGYEVIICDKNERAARKATRRARFRFIKNETKAIELSKIVVFATPTQRTAKLLKKAVSHMTQGALLIEISSVKDPLRKTIKALSRRGVQILSIHPMYGPDARNLRDKAVLVAHQPRHKGGLARTFLSTLTNRGARLIHCNLENHDQLVASTLTLPHLMNFAFVETLRHSGVSLNRAREMGGTTFKLQLLIAEALYHESSHNEASILADNKHGKQIVRTLVEQIDEIRRTILRTDRNGLTRRLRSDAAYASKDPLFPSAHARFSAAVEASSHI
jgi:prephenate dehydrogenase